MSSAPGRREVAHRLFAAEFDDADFSYSESDEERAPNYVVTPSGARVNRLFLVGVLTEVEQVNEEMLRARVVDPTGAFVVYAGQYQPDELAFLERVEPPTFLAVTGKARTFEPEDGDRVFTSVRPESINEVDAETRDRWVVNATERTLERVGTMAAAIETGLEGASLEAALLADGVDESLAAGVPLALDHYGTTPDYLAALREVALDAARLVADRADEVRSLEVAPGEGAGDAGALADRTIDVSDVDVESAAGSEAATEAAAGEPADPDSGTDVESAADADSEPAADSEAETDPGLETDSEPEAEATEAESAEVETATAGGGAETETTGEATEDAADDIGEFEPGEFDDEPGDETDDEGAVEGEQESETEEPPEDVLDDEERREIEEEYGTDFSTASEVDEPGEADVEPSESEAESGAAAEAEPEAQQEAEAEPEQEPEATPEEEAEVEAGDEAGAGETAEPTAEAEPTEPTADEEPREPVAEEEEPTEAADDDAAEGVPVDEAVMEEMRALDDGDGADREALIERVRDRTGAGADEVETAIQELLMSGQCYEPDDERLKPI